jgi:hypothetical protein
MSCQNESLLRDNDGFLVVVNEDRLQWSAPSRELIQSRLSLVFCPDSTGGHGARLPATMEKSEKVREDSGPTGAKLAALYLSHQCQNERTRKG